MITVEEGRERTVSDLGPLSRSRFFTPKSKDDRRQRRVGSVPRLQLFYFTLKFEIVSIRCNGATHCGRGRRTEMMALKALISRKWKLDNCSAERDRRARARGPEIVLESALKPNQM